MTLVPGSIVGAQITRPVVDTAPLLALNRDLSRRRPDCRVGVFLAMEPEDVVLTATRLAPLRFRAVVAVGPGMESVLREVLTDPTTLARDVVDWLEQRSIRLNPNQANLLERILAEAADHADLTTLLEHCVIPSSSARFRLRKRGLPSPTQWFQLARALHAALRLQAGPDVPLATLARQLGFVDHSALAHLLRRTLGVTSNEIRGTLGWEWLLHRWFTSRRLLTR
jgi:AraC-like DNA-binding protein